MSIVAIIPARGGSKGIPHKNVVHVGGKPLIAWSIEQANATQQIDAVLVATDSQEIADVAVNCGAAVHWRSELSATDEAPTEMVLMEVVTNYPADDYVFLQPTSPIRQHDDIAKAIVLLHGMGYDSVFSGRHVEGYTWTQDAECIAPNYETRKPRQQLDERTIEENGSIYVFKRKPFLWHCNRLCGVVGCYLMHPLDSFQIDTPEDISLIESLMEIRLGNRQARTQQTELVANGA